MKTRNSKGKKDKDKSVTFQLDEAHAKEVSDIAQRTDNSEAMVYRAAVRMALQIWKHQPNALMEALTNHPVSCIATAAAA